MKARFRVTYEIITPESAADGDVAERGFVDRLTLRDALAIVRTYPAASVHPLTLRTLRTVRVWFSSHPQTDYTTGGETIYSLHVPENITASSALRVARVVGALR